MQIINRYTVAICYAFALSACMPVSQDPDFVTHLGIEIWIDDDEAILYDLRELDRTFEVVRENIKHPIEPTDVRVHLVGIRPWAYGWCQPANHEITIWTQTGCIARTALPHELIHLAHKENGLPIDYEHNSPDFKHREPVIRTQLTEEICEY